MRALLSVTLVLIITVHSYAQTNLKDRSVVRKGFMIGLGVGGGALHLSTNDTLSVNFSASLPNLKVGYMLNKRVALLVLLPGANYKYKGKDRGFESFTLAAQYWIKENWWLMGGTGITFDAPAFYTVKNLETADFYTGAPAFTFATGYEIWRKGKFTVDLQYRIFIGKSNLPDNGERTGISNTFLVGFNWY